MSNIRKEKNKTKQNKTKQNKTKQKTIWGQGQEECERSLVSVKTMAQRQQGPKLLNYSNKTLKQTY
jgi:vacuolar-type H+-ATPase subunit E/Vma4